MSDVAVSARLRLPAAISRSPSGLAYFVYWAPYIAAYQLTNRFPLRAPRELAFTWLDEALPFVPALLPLYVSYLPFYWWMVKRLESERELNRLFYAAHAQLFFCLSIFVIFPVRMPRELFYGAEAHGWADAFWHWFDAPNNCFPSLHVASTLLLLQFAWGLPRRWLHVAIGAGIIASTVLVKQHYVVDVLGGLAVYLATRWLLARVDIVPRSAPERSPVMSRASERP
jgi:membrane-associated phospholipid phosphatase